MNEWARDVGHGIASDRGLGRRSPPDLHSLTKNILWDTWGPRFSAARHQSSSAGHAIVWSIVFLFAERNFRLCVNRNFDTIFDPVLPEPNRIFGLLNLSNREVLQTESGSIFGNVRVKVLAGRVKVHTNMCEPKVCSANRKLIFGFIFGSASWFGQFRWRIDWWRSRRFWRKPCCSRLEPQSDQVALTRKNVCFILACFATLRGGTYNQRGSSRSNCFTRGRVESEGWNGKGSPGQRRRKTTFTLMTLDVVFLLLFPSPLHPLLSTNKIHFFFRLSHDTVRGRDRWFRGNWIAWSFELENILEKTKSTLLSSTIPKMTTYSEEETKKSRSWCGVLQSQTAKAHGHMGRLEPASLNRTENFVQFQGPLAERSDGFSRKCAILFRTSHLAAARFRRSFRSSVCKTSLFNAETFPYLAKL